MRTRLLTPFVLLVAACGRTETIAGPQSDRSLAKPAAALFARSGSRQSAPLGLTGCWSGDGNATDVVFGNNGTLLGSVSYAKGEVGQAFSFNGLGGDVLIAQSPTLDVMQGDGITLAAWFYPKGQAFGNVAGSGPILEYDNGAQIWQHSQIQQDPSTTFFADMAASDLQQDWHILEAPFTVTQNAWNHGVVTYSKTSGKITSYVNGVQVGQANVGVINPRTAAPFHIGSREPGSFGATRYTFNGLIDEAQVYNRELTPAEVAQIASATTTLCTTPSQIAILTQPAGAEIGFPLTTQPSLQLLDASGVPVTFARTAVTATIASGTGTLLGTTTVNAVNGIATFLNLGIAGMGPVTLRFTATGLPTVTSKSITVTPVVSQVVVTSLPSSVASGVVLSPPPTVELRDAAGIKVASATNAVTASIGSGSGTLSGTLTVNAVAGVATFSNLIITGPGPNTLSFSAAPAAGPVSVISPSFTVLPAPTYVWSGFFDDVDAPPKLNKAKAGKEIDLEFGLGGDEGLDIFAAGSPASRPISCKTLASLGELVPLVMSSDHGDGDHGDGDHADDDHGGNKNKDSSSLSYNKKKEHYTLQWQTSKSFDDSCRAIVLTLVDGSTHTAYFNFSK